MTDTIAPQAGKRYKLRNGTITGVIQRDESVTKRVCFETIERIDGFFPMWDAKGKAEFFGGDEKSNRPYDIVEEYTE